MLIPSKAKAEATMDIAALDDNDPMTVEETVAAKRARDPAYSAAFKREQRRRL
jgi:ABC-type enterochelin transport system substrate-binding protein